MHPRHHPIAAVIDAQNAAVTARGLQDDKQKKHAAAQLEAAQLRWTNAAASIFAGSIDDTNTAIALKRRRHTFKYTADDEGGEDIERGTLALNDEVGFPLAEWLVRVTAQGDIVFATQDEEETLALASCCRTLFYDMLATLYARITDEQD